MSGKLIDLISSSGSGKAAARVSQVSIEARRRDLNFIKFSTKQTLARESSLATISLPIVRPAVAEGRHHNHYTPYPPRGGGSGGSGCRQMVSKMASVTARMNVSRPRSRNYGSLNNVSREQEGNNRLGLAEIATGASSSGFKSILACRSVPLLFILICSLIVANTRCDPVGSTTVGAESLSKENSIDSANIKDYHHQQQQREPMKPRHKPMDPLSMLREIYLDDDSKVITMLAPQGDTVQKFHPNGRYGRRSMDNYVEPHAELGHLVDDSQLDRTRSSSDDNYSSSDPSSALRRILHSLRRGDSLAGGADEGGQLGGRVHPAQQMLRSEQLASPSGQLIDRAPTKATLTQGTGDHHNSGPKLDNVFTSNGAQVANLQLEMNKLLKCNYSGISEFSSTSGPAKSLIARECYCPASAEEIFDYYDEAMLAIEPPPSRVQASTRSLDGTDLRLFGSPPTATGLANDGSVKSKNNNVGETKQVGDSVHSAGSSKRVSDGKKLPIESETSTGGYGTTSSKSKVIDKISMKSQARHAYYSPASNAYKQVSSAPFDKATKYAPYGSGAGYALARDRQRPQYEYAPYRQAQYLPPQQGQYRHQYKYPIGQVSAGPHRMRPTLFSLSSPAPAFYPAYSDFVGYSNSAPANVYQTGHRYDTPLATPSACGIEKHLSYRRPSKSTVSNEVVDQNDSALVEPTNIEEEVAEEKDKKKPGGNLADAIRKKIATVEDKLSPEKDKSSEIHKLKKIVKLRPDLSLVPNKVKQLAAFKSSAVEEQLDESSLEEAMAARVGHYMNLYSIERGHVDEDKRHGGEKTGQSGERDKSKELANSGKVEKDQGKAEEEGSDEEAEGTDESSSSERDGQEAPSSVEEQSDNKEDEEGHG